MRIQRKTELRKIVKECNGNTGGLDAVEFYKDGDWEIMSQSTYTNYCAWRCSVQSLATEHGYREKINIDKDITKNFQIIEGHL